MGSQPGVHSCELSELGCGPTSISSSGSRLPGTRPGASLTLPAPLTSFFPRSLLSTADPRCSSTAARLGHTWRLSDLASKRPGVLPKAQPGCRKLTMGLSHHTCRDKGLGE